MYNGIGLQTARGSGTNGYVQTNKFFVRPRTGSKPVNGGKGFEDDQGTAGLSKKPNKAILEHDRKRQIHLKLAILEDKLADQGYSDAEIAHKLEEARVNLEAAAAANEETDTPGDSKISDTQTHQVAARKEKQMEAFRAALGLPDQQEAEEGIIDDEPIGEAYEGRLKERREHSFLDRDSGRKRDEDLAEKDGKDKEIKKLRGDDDMDEVKRHKKRDSKKRRHGDSSDESDENGRDRRRRSKKKAKGRRQETDSESDSSSSESDSDSDDGKKRRRKATKKRSRSKRSISSESEEAESEDNKKLRKSYKKSRPANRSGSKEVRDKIDERSRGGRKRHDSDDSEPESEDNKQLRKKEEAYRGGRKQKRDDEDEESSPLKGTYRGDSGGKKAARDSDYSETEYENKKRLRSKVEVYSAGMSQKRNEEEAVPKHGKDKFSTDSRSKRAASDTDDSEAEYENRRKLKDESNERGRKHIRDEDDDYSNHGRDRYRSYDAVKRRGTIKEDDDYNKHKMDRNRGRGIEDEDNNKGDDDRDNRYRPRYEMAEEDDEYYKRGRDRYRGDKEDKLRGDAAGKRREDEDDDRVSRDKGRSHNGGRSSGKRSSYGDRD